MNTNTCKMNPKIKARWVKALLSGKYKKGTGQLRNHTRGAMRYCCLGVLSELWRLEVNRKRRRTIRWDNDLGFYSGKADLPSEVTMWAGLDHADPVVCGARLSQYNDGSAHLGIRPKPFRSIAKLIRENL